MQEKKAVVSTGVKHPSITEPLLGGGERHMSTSYRTGVLRKLRWRERGMEGSGARGPCPQFCTVSTETAADAKALWLIPPLFHGQPPSLAGPREKGS